MLIKKAYQGEFKHLLSILRSAILDNRTHVIFSKKKFGYSSILRSLRSAGIIESFEERNEIILVGLKQIYWKTLQNPLHSLSALEQFPNNRRGLISSKGITKYQNKKGQIVHVQISTDKNILTGLQAAATRVGGIPLFTIY